MGFFEQQSLASALEEWRSRCVVPVAELVSTTLKRLAEAGADFVDLFAEVLATAKVVDTREMS